jgi:hypothetical protein
MSKSKYEHQLKNSSSHSLEYTLDYRIYMHR